MLWASRCWHDGWGERIALGRAPRLSANEATTHRQHEVVGEKKTCTFISLSQDSRIHERAFHGLKLSSANLRESQSSAWQWDMDKTYREQVTNVVLYI